LLNKISHLFLMTNKPIWHGIRIFIIIAYSTRRRSCHQSRPLLTDIYEMTNYLERKFKVVDRKEKENKEIVRLGLIYSVEHQKLDIVYKDLVTNQIRIGLSDNEQSEEAPFRKPFDINEMISSVERILGH